jgi:hypothetical protein
MNSAVLYNCIKRSAEAGNSKAVGWYQEIDYRTRVSRPARSSRFMNGYRSQTYSLWNEKGALLGEISIKGATAPCVLDQRASRGNPEVIDCLNERCDDLVPTEGWGDRSQNCLHDMRIVGNT